MASQAFVPRDYSLDRTDLIPPDDEGADVQRQEYARLAASVDRQHVLDCVLSTLDAEQSPIYDLIDSLIHEPCLPGERPRENLLVLAKLGQAILDITATCVDEQIGMILAGGTRR